MQGDSINQTAVYISIDFFKRLAIVGAAGNRQKNKNEYKTNKNKLN